MATNTQVGHQVLPHYSLGGGMDRDSRPYEIADKRWRTVYNFRHNGGLSRVPRKKVVYELGGTKAVTWLGAVPRLTHAAWLAATQDELLLVRPASGTAVTKTSLAPLSGVDERLSHCYYNNHVWLVSPSNRVVCTDGSRYLPLTERRGSWSKPSGADMAGDGPFTGAEGPEDVDGTIIGDLGSTFDWTLGQYYRVYVEQPRQFEYEWIVRADWYGPEVGGMMGQVVGRGKDYIIVRATNDVLDVTNVREDKPLWVWTVEGQWPSGRYIRVFFDHLVIGAPTFKGRYEPWQVRWSGLRDFAGWVPETHTEADTYTCTEHQHHENLVEGVTGLEHYGDALLLFTATCIYAMHYVGLPPVVQVTPLIQGFGNGLYYATAALDNAVVWYDVNHGQFMLYRGQGPEAIGEGIDTYFAETLHQNPVLAQRTWAYVDKYNTEVVWVYVPVGSTTLSRAVVFNYKHKEWSVRSVEDLRCAGFWYRPVVPVADLAGEAGALSGSCADLGTTSTAVGAVYGTTLGRVVAEAASGTVEGDLLASDTAYLETGDFMLGDVQTVKEMDQIAMSASGSVQVEVSARAIVDGTVTFTNVGTWTQTLATGRVLPFAGGALSGGVFRFKLTPVSTNQWTTISLIETNVLNIGAAR